MKTCSGKSFWSKNVSSETECCKNCFDFTVDNVDSSLIFDAEIKHSDWMMPVT